MQGEENSQGISAIMWDKTSPKSTVSQVNGASVRMSNWKYFTVSEVTTLWRDRNVCIIIIFLTLGRYDPEGI